MDAKSLSPEKFGSKNILSLKNVCVQQIWAPKCFASKKFLTCPVPTWLDLSRLALARLNFKFTCRLNWTNWPIPTWLGLSSLELPWRDLFLLHLHWLRQDIKKCHKNWKKSKRGRGAVRAKNQRVQNSKVELFDKRGESGFSGFSQIKIVRKSNSLKWF